MTLKVGDTVAVHERRDGSRGKEVAVGIVKSIVGDWIDLVYCPEDHGHYKVNAFGSSERFNVACDKWVMVKINR